MIKFVEKLIELPFFQYMVCDQGKGSNDVTEKGAGKGYQFFGGRGHPSEGGIFNFLG